MVTILSMLGWCVIACFAWQIHGAAMFLDNQIRQTGMVNANIWVHRLHCYWNGFLFSLFTPVGFFALVIIALGICYVFLG
jgi:hypothetical protein